MLVSLNDPKCILENMHTCFVDSDDEDFYIHEDILILGGEKK